MLLNFSKLIKLRPTAAELRGKILEEFIKEHSGDFKKTELFNNLPKKMMWGTFNVILSYLVENNKIGIDKSDHVIYIWNPGLAEKFMNKKRY